MAPARRGGKSGSSTPKLVLLAIITILAGLGAGILLSRVSCSPRPKRHIEPKGTEPKRAEPLGKPAPKPRPPAAQPERLAGEPAPEPGAEPEKTVPHPSESSLPAKPSHPEKAPAEPIKPLPEKHLPKAPEKAPTHAAERGQGRASDKAVPRKPESGPAKPAAKVQQESASSSSLPKLALVIDDLGYVSLDLVKRLCKEPVPFSVAVLPYQDYTRESADLAASMGKEILLHLPMEPIGYPAPGKDPGPNAVMFDLKESEIRSRVRAALDTVPRAVGVNNHMGSRITPDRPRMTWVLQEIKARRCFFLDSRTEKDSVAMDVAHALKVPSVQRKVFLDDDKSFAEMAKQWERAVEIARKEGQVVIIGHIYPETVEALEKLIPASRGKVRFVKAGDLVR